MFSVIIPAYNAEPYIEETLRSVFLQTFPHFEVIVVDDGSEDGTLEIVRGFQNDRRLSIYSISHLGTPAAVRNFALRRATGEYIAFLDADDLWREDKLERCYQYIQQTTASILFSNGILIDAVGKSICRMLSPKMRTHFPSPDPLLLMTNLMPCSSVVLKRNILPSIPFNEDKAYLASEDYQLWLTLNMVHGIHYLAESLISYRIHPSQTLNNYRDQLSIVENVLSNSASIEGYGASAVELARLLIVVRRMFLQHRFFDMLIQSIRLLLRTTTCDRRILIEYIRYGLIQRTKGRLVRQWR